MLGLWQSNILTYRSACCTTLSLHRNVKFLRLRTSTRLCIHRSAQYMALLNKDLTDMGTGTSIQASHSPEVTGCGAHPTWTFWGSELNLHAFIGERGERANHHYLTGHVGVEHFAFDDKPELLPVPLAFLTPAKIATYSRTFSRGRHLEKEKQNGQGTPGSGHNSNRDKMTCKTVGRVFMLLWNLRLEWGLRIHLTHFKGSKNVPWFETQDLLNGPRKHRSQRLPSGLLPPSGVSDSWSSSPSLNPSN